MPSPLPEELRRAQVKYDEAHQIVATFLERTAALPASKEQLTNQVNALEKLAGDAATRVAELNDDVASRQRILQQLEGEGQRIRQQAQADAAKIIQEARATAEAMLDEAHSALSQFSSKFKKAG